MRRGNVRYDQVRQKSVHNAYQRDEPIRRQVLERRIHSLELDLHGSGNDWKVYHWLLDPESSVTDLSHGLSILGEIHRADPGHDVITVFLDLKTPFSRQRVGTRPGTRGSRRPKLRGGRYTAARLDGLIRGHLARKWLFTPEDLRGGAPDTQSLQVAAAWPTLNDLIGKFVFALTGPQTRLEHYRKVARDPVAFVAPRIDSEGGIDANREAVFFNLSGRKERRRLGRLLLNRGLVSRSYVLNREEDWEHAVETGIHHLATDCVDEREFGWATTRSNGSPFRRIES